MLSVVLGIKGIADLTITNQLFWLMSRQDPLQEGSNIHLDLTSPPPPDGLEDCFSSAVTEIICLSIRLSPRCVCLHECPM